MWSICFDTSVAIERFVQPIVFVPRNVICIYFTRLLAIQICGWISGGQFEIRKGLSGRLVAGFEVL